MTNKYLKQLALYSKWNNCRTPLEQFSSFLYPFWLEDEPLFAYKSAEEAIYAYESLGVGWPTSDQMVLSVLWHGKAKRDWWAKEIREWFRLGSGLPLFSPTEFEEILPRQACRREVEKWLREQRLNYLRNQIAMGAQAI